MSAPRRVAMAGAQKISRFVGPSPFASGATAQPVCEFGLVTASGQLVEAHSLQRPILLVKRLSKL
jgi:hypothetical protein